MKHATEPVTLELSGEGLTLDDAEHLLLGHVERLVVPAAARKRYARALVHLRNQLVASGLVEEEE